MPVSKWIFTQLGKHSTSALNCLSLTMHFVLRDILSGLFTLWLMHLCFFRQTRDHLCWGPHPWDLYSWKELQARQQLPVALQAFITSWWHEQEDHTLCWGRWCWQQGGSDQQNDQEDELSCWWVLEKFQSADLEKKNFPSMTWFMMHILFSPSYRLWWKYAWL